MFVAISRPAAPIAHLALTVTDLERSIEWYTALFDTDPMFRGIMREGTKHEHRVAVWANPNVGLHHFAEPTPGVFDERRPGLDHVAFECADLDELHRWADHLDALGAARSEIVTEGHGAALSFRDPDHIALEFYVDSLS